MDTLSINTGEKRIPITRDGESVGTLVFNPSDVVFAEKFYSLVKEFETKLSDYSHKHKVLDRNDERDESGVPFNMPDRLLLLRETCTFVREKIDFLFGKGTSELVFGNAMTIDMFTQFFDGITPFVRAARTSKTLKYAPFTEIANRNRKRHK